MNMTFIRPVAILLSALSLGMSPLQAQAEASGCGSEPAIARATILGRLYGEMARAGEGRPWEPYIGVKPDSVQAFTDEAACAGVLMAAAESETEAATDSLPLKGIVNLGDLGVVIVRGRGKPGERGSVQTMALLDADLVVRSYHRMQF